jgi:hypothetical protein
MLKAYRGGEDIVPEYDQLYAPIALSPERTDGTQWLEGPVGTRADTEKAAKRKISIPTGTRTPVIKSVFSNVVNSRGGVGSLHPEGFQHFYEPCR